MMKSNQDAEVTAATFHQGAGIPSGGGRYSLEDVVMLEYGSIENFRQCEFVYKPKLKDAYRNAQTKAAKWDAIREYYKFVQPLIDRAVPTKWAVVYDLALDDDFTPIEVAAWEALRRYSVPMYPQYPTLGYFLDFAHPVLKIDLELDGRDWHDPMKDAARDAKLIADNWTVYRVTGADCLRILPDPYQIEKYTGDGEARDPAMINQALRAWYTQTVDGLVMAIKHAHYRRLGDYFDHRHIDFIDEALMLHRIRQ